MTNFRLFKIERLDEYGRKLSERVENTVGKGEILSNFSFSHSVFKRLVLQTRKNQGLFPKRHFSDSSKLKEFADHNFKFDTNGGVLSEEVENTVEKGEMALYGQFLLSHSVFKRLILQTRENKGLFGQG